MRTYRVQDSNNVSIGSHIFKVLVQFHIQFPILGASKSTFTGFYHEIPPLKILFIVSQAQGISFRTINSSFDQLKCGALKELNLYFVDGYLTLYLLNQEFNMWLQKVGRSQIGFLAREGKTSFSHCLKTSESEQQRWHPEASEVFKPYFD